MPPTSGTAAPKKISLSPKLALPAMGSYTVFVPSPRILCIQSTSIFENYGGIESYLDDLLSHLADLNGPGNICTLVPQTKPVTPPLNRPYRVERFPVSPRRGVFRKLHNRFSAKLLKTGLALIREFKPNLILCGHVSLGPLCFLLSKFGNTPYASVVYGVEAWGNLFIQDEWALRHSQTIYSISEWTKTRLEERGIASAKIRVIHPGLNEDFSVLSAPTFPSNRPVFTLLTVSRLDAGEGYKGHDHVLQALALFRQRHPEIPFKYIIQGSGSDLARLTDLVFNLHLEDPVEFRNPVSSRKDLIQTYSEADVFIMPSRFGRWQRKWHGEGFGIVFAEAAACGVPSIAYDCGGAQDIIIDGKTGFLVAPDSITALYEKILHLATHQEDTRRMGKSAYRHVMDQFSYGAIQAKIRQSATLTQ